MCLNIIKNKGVFRIDPQDFKIIKKNYLWSFTNDREFNDFIKNNNLENIILSLLSNSYKKLLLKEYFDLFNRIRCGLNLSTTMEQNVKSYLNNDLSYFNGFYSSTQINKNQSYPYKCDVIDKYLFFIQNENYEFFNCEITFNGLKRSLID